MLGEQFINSVPSESNHEPVSAPPGLVNQIRNVENADVLQQYMPLRNRRSIEATRGDEPSTQPIGTRLQDEFLASDN